jgi:hypothetical protein
MSGGQPVAGCGHPGDEEIILKSHLESPCATSSGALEISLRHRETGTGPEGNFGSLEEEVDRPEGNFKADDGGLGHVKERRLNGSFGTQGNLSSESEGPVGVHRNAGQLAFGQRRAPRQRDPGQPGPRERGGPEHWARCLDERRQVPKAQATEQSDAKRGETGRGPSISCMEGPRRTFGTGECGRPTFRAVEPQ